LRQRKNYKAAKALWAIRVHKWYFDKPAFHKPAVFKRVKTNKPGGSILIDQTIRLYEE